MMQPTWIGLQGGDGNEAQRNLDGCASAVGADHF